MFHLPANPVIVTIASFVAAVILTYLVRAAARRYGFVAAPKSDRWHKKPTAMYGGVAIFLTTILMYAIFIPKTVDSIVVMGSATILFLVGLIDDFLNIKPYQKLIGQLIGAAVVVGFGLSLPLTGNEIIDIWLTVFWLIGITNAINLLDNMDGLSAGIAAIAAFSLAVSFGANDQPNELFSSRLLSARSSDFWFTILIRLRFLWAIAARCSSVFCLQARFCSIKPAGARAAFFRFLAVPALILFVPIFDTTFVTVLRKICGAEKLRRAGAIILRIVSSRSDFRNAPPF
jgi:UDP-GlcNAc:undecaprenyl-phosphate GlcNAc-1-phosphate transferase